MGSNPVKSMLTRSKLNRGLFAIQLVLIFFVIFGSMQVGLAGVFSYRDDTGAIHFTDDISKIPQKYRDSENGVRTHSESRAYRATPSPPQAIELPGSASSSGEVQVPLIPVGGGNFLVDTMLNGHVKARLMLDTGASFITLTEEIGSKLGISTSSGSAELPFNTAGGEDWMPLVALDTVSVGSAKTRLVEASINSHIKEIDGLLGMSFLGDFRFEIDRTNKLLTLKPPQAQGELVWDNKPGNWWKSRFEHYDATIKSYASRASLLRRRGHAKSLNMQNTVEFYKALRQKLETRASISGLPVRFRPSM